MLLTGLREGWRVNEKPVKEEERVALKALYEEIEGQRVSLVKLLQDGEGKGGGGYRMRVTRTPSKRAVVTLEEAKGEEAAGGGAGEAVVTL